jgi:hypothetical protein
MAQTPAPKKQSTVQQPSGTILETDEDIRLALTKQVTAAPPSSPARSREVRPYHPTLRAPVALLTVLDDGKNDGEVIRLRTERFVIGRREGDLLLPHDGMISSRHVEITRQKVDDSYQWVITDLQTTNGLFARVSRIGLASGAEFLVGKGRYRFETSAPSQLPKTIALGGEFGATQPWGGDASALLGGASLLEVVPGSGGTRVVLTQAEYWIGSDPSCAIRRDTDPFVEARHVRLWPDGKGAWQAQHNKALNGLWLRVPQVTVEESCTFQIGEQRLRLKVGG